MPRQNLLLLVLLAGICTCVCGPAQAQTQIRKLQGRIVQPLLQGSFRPKKVGLAAPLPLMRSVCAADFNGDSRADLLIWPYVAPAAPIALLATDSGFESLKVIGSPTVSGESLPKTFDQLACGDIDGDGLADFAAKRFGKTVIARNTGISEHRELKFEVGLLTLDAKDRQAEQLFVADLLGDKRAEIVFVNAAQLAAYAIAQDRTFARVDEQAIPPEMHVAGLADTDADGKFEFITCDLVNRVCYRSNFKRRWQKLAPAWAMFPVWMELRHFLLADFNGDNRTDLFTHGDWPYGAWIAFADEESAIEQMVPEISSLGKFVADLSLSYAKARKAATANSPRQRMVSGDFNADGTDDVALLAAESQQIDLQLSEFAQPLSAITVQNKEYQAQSDANGYFAIELTEDQTDAAELQIDSADYVAHDGGTRVMVAVRAGKLATVDLYQTAPRADGYVGQPVQLGPDQPGPYVCIGYNPGSPSKWGDPLLRCPKNYAMFGASEVPGRVRHPAYARTGPRCCRLPFDDILTSEEAVVPVECPDNYIAVGVEDEQDYVSRPHDMRCAKINTQRYSLGPVTTGIYHGTGLNMRRYGGAYYIENLPLAIRNALVRRTESTFDLDGCHGSPYGSLLMRKGKRCWDHGYRQLMYNGLRNDPAQGTPVEMFPDCSDLQDAFNPATGCRIKAKEN